MLQRLSALRDAEDGFSLIELMVVLLIMGILVGLGLPAFLGVKGRFQDRAAESKVRDSVLAARILYTDQASFATATSAPGQLDQIDPTTCWVAAATASIATGASGTCVSGAGDGSVSVLGQGPNPNRFAAAKMSQSQKCFLILDTLQGTFYGSTSTAANCTANYAASGAVTATTPIGGGW
jgi:type IV pilus assembly protein PilA